MTHVIRFEEDVAAIYPQLVELESVAGAPSTSDTCDVDPAVWDRLESYVAHRWTPRQAVWTVQGGDDLFTPHLSPLSSVVIDQWDSVLKVWETSTTATAAPTGYCLPCADTVYRITATVGANADPVPQIVVAAYSQLDRYMKELYSSDAPAGSAEHSLSLDAGLTESVKRSPAWLAKAMQYSGAGDLLRGYRRV